jgi:hypothetical protein
MVSTTFIIIVQFLEGLGCHFRFVGFGRMIIVIFGFGFWKEDSVLLRGYVFLKEDVAVFKVGF